MNLLIRTGSDIRLWPNIDYARHKVKMATFMSDTIKQTSKVTGW